MMDYSNICPYCHATPEEGCRCNRRPSVHQMALEFAVKSLSRFVEETGNTLVTPDELADNAYAMARAMWERGEKEEGE